MRKRFVLLFSCCVMFLAACTQTSGNEVEMKEENLRLTNELNEKEKELKNLRESAEGLNHQIAQFEEEKEKFVIISNLSRDFVSAHKTGDQETLRKLLSKDLALKERDEKLYVEASGVEWVLFDYADKGSLDDWVLQGFDFNSETNKYSVFIREYYTDENSKPVSPPTFLNLVFEYQDDQWIIIDLGFDV